MKSTTVWMRPVQNCCKLLVSCSVICCDASVNNQSAHGSGPTVCHCHVLFEHRTPCLIPLKSGCMQTGQLSFHNKTCQCMGRASTADWRHPKRWDQQPKWAQANDVCHRKIDVNSKMLLPSMMSTRAGCSVIYMLVSVWEYRWASCPGVKVGMFAVHISNDRGMSIASMLSLSLCMTLSTRICENLTNPCVKSVTPCESDPLCTLPCKLQDHQCNVGVFLEHSTCAHSTCTRNKQTKEKCTHVLSYTCVGLYSMYMYTFTISWYYQKFDCLPICQSSTVS